MLPNYSTAPSFYVATLVLEAFSCSDREFHEDYGERCRRQENKEDRENEKSDWSVCDPPLFQVVVGSERLAPLAALSGLQCILLNATPSVPLQSSKTKGTKRMLKKTTQLL